MSGHSGLGTSGGSRIASSLSKVESLSPVPQYLDLPQTSPSRCVIVPPTILTTRQQINTIKSDEIRPAVPTIQPKRIKNSTPKMFCTQGKKTPIKVPMVAGCCDF
uniref:Uncharacterized protein n=1 Tax=Romanomermis culicivorax TaxID=13658 RepID=A0A915HV45_ROMCU